MKVTTAIVPFALVCLGAAACAPSDAGARVGELSVALSSRLGDVDYHLTGATLRIDGPEPREVSLDGPGTLNLTLPAGPHQLTLVEGWSLTRGGDGDGMQPVPAQLLSENPTSLFIGAGSSEQLSFRFALEDGEVVQSGEGQLEVGFELADGGADDGDLSLGCAGALRIDEVDYDQQGTDDAEFVEVRNAGVCDASLDGVALELVNGNSGETYGRVDLSELGSLAAAGALLVADPAVLDAAPEDVPGLELPGSGLQNGPDSVRLLVGDTVVDLLGYGEGAPDAEGAPSVEDGPEMSIGRCPSGFDTDDNARDFAAMTASPGADNDC